MSIEVSQKTEVRLTEEARKQGLSVADLIDRLALQVSTSGTRFMSETELPLWHLGAVGELHRRDIYSDAD